MRSQNLTLREASRFVAEHHRHNKPPQGHKFSIGAVVNGELVGVCIVGRPVARKLDDGETAEVTRLCTNKSAPMGVPSYLHRRVWSAWAAMGGLRLVTYTLAGESGASLRGAGFRVVGQSPAWAEGKGWTTRGGREWQPVHMEGKVRWELAERKGVES